jgi:hypothetical protein
MLVSEQSQQVPLVHQSLSRTKTRRWRCRRNNQNQKEGKDNEGTIEERIRNTQAPQDSYLEDYQESRNLEHTGSPRKCRCFKARDAGSTFSPKSKKKNKTKSSTGPKLEDDCFN